MKKPIKVVADRTVARMADFVCGANDADFHYTGVNWGRDLPEPDAVADVRNVVAGDPSPDGKGVLAIQRGIEVGHVFLLGTKYSEPMKATYLDETGKPQLMVMGCYGIGVTRLLGAAVEQNHDERGMIWPVSMAPFSVVICPIGYDRSAEVRAAADHLHDELSAQGIDVLLDDRSERPGAMFADWEPVSYTHLDVYKRQSDQFGAAGPDIEMRMPVGTIISNAETGQQMAELLEHGQRTLIAKGGDGGFGNLHFKSSTNRSPRQKTPGWPGEAFKLKLELRVLADVGLLGMPNAGKSTLIAAISNARPKIADYPFTTLHPNLGVVRVGPERSFVVADVPGLIEGCLLYTSRCV